MPQLRDRVLAVNGQEILLQSIGALAGQLSVNPETIKLWEDAGVVPPSTFVDDAGRRWYAEGYIREVRKAVAVWRKKGDGKLESLKPLAWVTYRKGGV